MITFNEIYNLTDPNILNVYQYGSRVYGSHNDNSDYDYIVVVKEHFEPISTDIHIFTEESFKLAIYEHEISVLECLWLSDDLKLKETIDFKDDFVLDKQKLRTSISTIVNNSYVKAKKKLIIIGDYDLNAGLKSFFHSYRILNFGVQIAIRGKIYNYGSCNWLLNELHRLGKMYSHNELWNIIETKYKESHKTKKHTFKRLCPKDKTTDFNLDTLNIWFKNNGLNEMTLKQFNKFNNEIIKKI